MTALEILKAARARISDPVRWTQGEMARDKNGFTVRAKSDSSVCWCAIGAIYRESRNMAEEDSAVRALSSVCDINTDSYWHNVTIMNDKYDHQAVLMHFDEAIADLELKN